jgi:hypothetical protein
LEKAGHEIVAVYSRTENSASALAANLKHAQTLTEPDIKEQRTKGRSFPDHVAR